MTFKYTAQYYELQSPCCTLHPQDLFYNWTFIIFDHLHPFGTHPIPSPLASTNLSSIYEPNILSSEVGVPLRSFRACSSNQMSAWARPHATAMHTLPAAILGWLDAFIPCLSPLSKNNTSICLFWVLEAMGVTREKERWISSLSSMYHGYKSRGSASRCRSLPRGLGACREWCIFFLRVVGVQGTGAARLWHTLVR